MQPSSKRSLVSSAHLSCFELRISSWMMTVALLTTALGCGTISDAPHRSIATSAVLPTVSLNDNPPVDEPQTDISSFENPSPANILRSPETEEASPPASRSTPTPSTIIETGLASWYGPKHQGKRTASGEIFDQNKFTAAHRTLPWGSIVKVTNLENGKSVEVRINDRGPFTEGRVIDLSRAAARALGIIKSGISPVRTELLSPRAMSSDLVLQNR